MGDRRLKGVAILGATGSIGRTALEVLAHHRDRFRLVGVAAARNGAMLADLVATHRPEVAVLTEAPIPADVPAGVEWRRGWSALLELACDPRVDIVLNALVGAAGLEPTLAALASGKRVALANKESLVCGGALVEEAARRGGGEVVPVDSEHSAIWQCLVGRGTAGVRRVVLTASGGPFRNWSAEALVTATVEQALQHPTWRMGAKITVDSATLVNKALEVIEAHHLFGLPYEAIDVVVHPQSVVHSFVEFVDGAVLAQLGLPSMAGPILYALSYPERWPHPTPRFDPVALGSLTFEPVRQECFPAFRLGIEAGRRGEGAPIVFNAANEVAVAAFLERRLRFVGIPVVLERVLTRWTGAHPATFEEVRAIDAWARAEATRTLTEEPALWV